METPDFSRFSEARSFKPRILSEPIQTESVGASLLSNMVCALRGHAFEGDGDFPARGTRPEDLGCEGGHTCTRCGDLIANNSLQQACRADFAA